MAVEISSLDNAVRKGGLVYFQTDRYEDPGAPFLSIRYDSRHVYIGFENPDDDFRVASNINYASYDLGPFKRSWRQMEKLSEALEDYDLAPQIMITQNGLKDILKLKAKLDEETEGKQHGV
ncbi:MAG TPA: hypothetical protein VJH34_01515 [archaeon]|nr:hypothetical protein [archaeon]